MSGAILAPEGSVQKRYSAVGMGSRGCWQAVRRCSSFRRTLPWLVRSMQWRDRPGSWLGGCCPDPCPLESEAAEAPCRPGASVFPRQVLLCLGSSQRGIPTPHSALPVLLVSPSAGGGQLLRAQWLLHPTQAPSPPSSAQAEPQPRKAWAVRPERGVERQAPPPGSGPGFPWFPSCPGRLSRPGPQPGWSRAT